MKTCCYYNRRGWKTNIPAFLEDFACFTVFTHHQCYQISGGIWGEHTQRTGTPHQTQGAPGLLILQRFCSMTHRNLRSCCRRKARTYQNFSVVRAVWAPTTYQERNRNVMAGWSIKTLLLLTAASAALEKKPSTVPSLLYLMRHQKK